MQDSQHSRPDGDNEPPKKKQKTDEKVDENRAKQIALRKESYRTGSEACSIIMLQQFECSIKSVKNFKGMASIPASVEIGDKN